MGKKFLNAVCIAVCLEIIRGHWEILVTHKESAMVTKKMLDLITFSNFCFTHNLTKVFNVLLFRLVQASMPLCYSESHYKRKPPD